MGQPPIHCLAIDWAEPHVLDESGSCAGLLPRRNLAPAPKRGEGNDDYRLGCTGRLRAPFQTEPVAGLADAVPSRTSSRLRARLAAPSLADTLHRPTAPATPIHYPWTHFPQADWKLEAGFSTWAPENRNRIFYARYGGGDKRLEAAPVRDASDPQGAPSELQPLRVAASSFRAGSRASTIDGVYLTGDGALSVQIRAAPPPPRPIVPRRCRRRRRTRPASVRIQARQAAVPADRDSQGLAALAGEAALYQRGLLATATYNGCLSISTTVEGAVRTERLVSELGAVSFQSRVES